MIPAIRIPIVCTLLILTMLWTTSTYAFRKVALGTEVPNTELVTLAGKRQKLFNPRAKVNVFLFFRPNQKYSQSTLRILSRICNAYIKRGVRCVAIVSDYYKKTTVKSAIKAADWSAHSTYIDVEDLYSAKIGVILYPAVGITDASLRLQAYEPFVKINYAQRIEANIRFLLEDISEKQLRSALQPALHDQKPNNSDKAILNYNLAKKLYELGEYEKAVNQAEHALELNPNLADGYALIGSIRAKQRRCEEAKIQFQKALQLDKDNEQATKGMARCK